MAKKRPVGSEERFVLLNYRDVGMPGAQFQLEAVYVCIPVYSDRERLQLHAINCIEILQLFPREVLARVS